MVVVQEHPSELVRDSYLMEVAARCRLDPGQLRGRTFKAVEVPGARRRTDNDASGRGQRVTEDRRPRVPGRDTAGAEALRLFVSRRDEIAPWLDETLFPNHVENLAYRSLIHTDSVAAAVEMAGNEDPAAGDLLQRLAVEETDADVLDVVTRLVDEASSSALAALKAEAQVAADPFEVGSAIAWLSLRIMELREPHTVESARAELHSWLVGAEAGAEGVSEADLHADLEMLEEVE